MSLQGMSLNLKKKKIMTDYSLFHCLCFAFGNQSIRCHLCVCVCVCVSLTIIHPLKFVSLNRPFPVNYINMITYPFIFALHYSSEGADVAVSL